MADVTLVVSDEERDHLEAVEPGVDVEVVPNANPIAGDVPGHAERSGVLFVGNFGHAPNVDAAIHLATDVMALVWQEEPGISLTIAGPSPPAEVRALASASVDVLGWVEDLTPLLRESIAAVAPLRFGAGMKGKVTQSLAAGLPVVTTTIGAEGLHASDGNELMIADDPQGLADRILTLTRDADVWLSLSGSGRALAERVCSPAVQAAAIDRLLRRSRRHASVRASV
jgi:glycosyltransferase involved in cell wall biosynthesis